MTDQMTDSDTIHWGDLAEAVIDNPAYIALYDKITMDLAKEILATPADDEKYRKQLYDIYDGMRAFGTRLVNMTQAKHEVIKRIDAENGIEEDFDE